MQRWIVLGAVMVVLMFGGGIFAYRGYKQNQPQPIWVPLPINRQLPGERRTELAKELKAKLAKPEILAQVAKDSGLARIWGLNSDAEAGQEIGRRLFVRVGDAATPTGNVPSINVGVNGKVKEKAISEKLSLRLIEDVWKILGVNGPNKKTP